MTTISRLAGVPTQSSKRAITLDGTEGETYLQLVNRQLQLLQLYASKQERKDFAYARTIIDRALVRGIHNIGSRIITSPLPETLYFLPSVLEKAGQRSYPALIKNRSRIGASDFAPTPMQSAQCHRDYLIYRERGDTYDFNLMKYPFDGDICTPSIYDANGLPIGPAPELVDGNGNPMGIIFSDPYCQLSEHPADFEIGDKITDCVWLSFYTNLFNEYMEDSGPALLYNFIADEETYANAKIIALQKRFEAIRYIGGLANISGMSKENLDLWVRNGILAGAGANQPEDILGRMNNMTQADYDQIGELGTAVILAIIGLVSLAVTSATAIALEIIKESPTEAAENRINDFDVPPNVLAGLMGPNKNDWKLRATGGSGSNGNGGGGGSGSGGGSNNGLLIGGLFLGGILLLNNQNS